MKSFIAQNKKLKNKRIEVISTNPAMMEFLFFDTSSKEFGIIEKDFLFRDYRFVKYSGDGNNGLV